MRERAVEVLVVATLATVVTLAIAIPVLVAPSARIFGMDIVGRHHDPFTMMEQFRWPLTLNLSTQPITDFTGAALARVASPVAAYNWLVLISFPLAAAAAYLLARHLTLSPAGAAVAALVLVAAGEYAVSPLALSRDVLPTTAHRWVMQQAGPVCVLDCTPLTEESASVAWLTGTRVSLLDGTLSECIEPNLPEKLAAEGYAHLLVRQDNREGRAFFERPAPSGLRLAARFRGAQIFAVSAAAPSIYTAAMTCFWPREHDGQRTWRWMGEAATWTVVNTAGRPVVARLAVEVSAFDHPRRLDLAFDGQKMQTLVVAPERRIYEAGPFTVTPGRHEPGFRALAPPAAASDVGSSGDPRRLSYAVGEWTWTVLSRQP